LHETFDRLWLHWVRYSGSGTVVQWSADQFEVLNLSPDVYRKLPWKIPPLIGTPLDLDRVYFKFIAILLAVLWKKTNNPKITSQKNFANHVIHCSRDFPISKITFQENALLSFASQRIVYASATAVASAPAFFFLLTLKKKGFFRLLYPNPKS